jgi:hypothetical protein
LANKAAATWHENRAVTICAALPAGSASTTSQTLAACANPKPRGAFVLLFQRMTTPARRTASSI